MTENSIIELTLDGKLVAQAAAATTVFKGLEKVVDEVGASIREAFSIGGYKDYLKTVGRFGKDLTDELLVLQLSFGKMKSAIADAVAPVASVLVPVLNQAIGVVTRFAGVMEEFLWGLIQGITGQDALTESARDAAKAEKNLEKAAVSAGAAVKRSLMGFDQINRLAGGSGSGGSSVTEDLQITLPDTISPQVQQMVDKVLSALEPLRTIDMEPLRQALAKVNTAFTNMAQQAWANVQWLWKEMLVPFVKWMAEVLAPALFECFAARLEMIHAAMTPLSKGLQALYQALLPVVNFVGERVVAVLEYWQSQFLLLAYMMREKTPQITAIMENLATVLTALWNKAGPVLEKLGEAFSSIFGGVSSTASTVGGHLIDALKGITDFLSGVFTKNWKQAWDGVKNYLKGVVNSIIGLLNSMLSRFGNAINAVIQGANSLRITIPSWVPGYGGRTYSVNLRKITVPQIPYLAQGAVLPANRPFMAVVGDQRHGTNIEAPLATIEEAVAGVMQDYAGGNMAGHEATVAVLQQILEAVLGIRIGDETIARAVQRHQRTMAMVKGV